MKQGRGGGSPGPRRSPRKETGLGQTEEEPPRSRRGGRGERKSRRDRRGGRRSQGRGRGGRGGAGESGGRGGTPFKR